MLRIFFRLTYLRIEGNAQITTSRRTLARLKPRKPRCRDIPKQCDRKAARGPTPSRQRIPTKSFAPFKLNNSVVRFSGLRRFRSLPCRRPPGGIVPPGLFSAAASMRLLFHFYGQRWRPPAVRRCDALRVRRRVVLRSPLAPCSIQRGWLRATKMADFVSTKRMNAIAFSGAGCG